MKKGSRFIEKYENELNDIIRYVDGKKTLSAEKYSMLNKTIFLYNVGRLSFVESALIIGSIIEFDFTKQYEIKNKVDKGGDK